MELTQENLENLNKLLSPVQKPQQLQSIENEVLHTISNSLMSGQAGVIQKMEKNDHLDLKKQKDKQKRQKYLDKQKGLYVPNLLERAKEFLANNQLDYGKLKDEAFWVELSENERKKLEKFISDKKRNTHFQRGRSQLPPKSPESKPQITKEQLNTINNIQVNRNEAISKAIFEAEGLENLKAVMWRLNKQNHIAILEFLKSLENVPFDGFLQVLMQVIDECEDHTQQIRLLVGLCGIYSGQKLAPAVDLCCSTLSYLANKDGVTTVQVIGFLKFTFVTKGDIHNAELFDLKEFDRRHMQCFHAFKSWLQRTFKLPSDLILVLPNSCYILGKPFAKRLKDGGLTLTEHVPSDFLQLFIQILTFSFERDGTEFVTFLHITQQGFLELVEKINTTQLLNLFSSLFNVITEHNNQWYRNMRNSRALIEGALGLVKESKIKSFSSDICQNLLSGVGNIDEYLNRPSLIKKETNQDNDQKLKQIIQLNQENFRGLKFLKKFDAAQKLPAHIVSAFAALKIIPHFIQELALKIQLQNTDNPRLFLSIAPGQGKTKLILASAINLVQTKSPVLILNTNKTLLNRDFQEAVPVLDMLNISCAKTLSHNAKITFITVDEFIQLRTQLPPNYHAILDEHHNVFFNKKLLFGILELLQQSITFTGFSGSPLISLQKKLLHQCFTDQVLELQLTPPSKLESEGTIVCKTQRDQVKELALIAKKYQLLVPQVFILNEATAAALMKGKAKEPYISLINADAAVVNTTLSQLFNKPLDNKQFGTYIINEEMGTGTDFKTSADIENNGGLFLVFGVKITSTSTFEQLSYRVGRIFQKGRRAYIINDAKYTGSSKEYLQFQLNILRQKEKDEARDLLNDLKKKVGNIDSESDIQDFDAMSEENNDNGKAMMMMEDDCSQLQNKENQQNANIKEECKFCENDHEEGYVCKVAINKDQFAQATFQTNQQQLSASDTALKLSTTNENTAQRVEQIIQKTDQNPAVEEDEKHKDSLDVVMIEQKDAASVQQKHIPQVIPQKNQKDLLVKRSAATNTSQLEQKIKEKSGKVTNNKSTKNFEKQVNEDLEIVQRQHPQTKRQQKIVEGIKAKTPKELIDGRYYSNYSKFGIHKAMLNDNIRMEQYQKAIELVCKGKLVLDIGCGTGILSGFAAKAGALQVIAVDNANVGTFLRKKLKEMGAGFKEQVKFINDSIENLAAEDAAQSKVPQVDVIVSEWMGYFLLFENMISSYLLGIKKFLKPEGIMIPSKAAMFLHAISYNLNDANKTPAKKYLTTGNYQCKYAMIEQCKAEYLLSDDITNIKSFDFTDRNLQNPLENGGFISKFEIKVNRQGTLNAFVGSFEAKLYEGVFLNTMPNSPETHWKQSIFFISNPIQVDIGDMIEGEIEIAADEENYRNLIIKLRYNVENKGSSVAKECFTFE